MLKHKLPFALIPLLLLLSCSGSPETIPPIPGISASLHPDRSGAPSAETLTEPAETETDPPAETETEPPETEPETAVPEPDLPEPVLSTFVFSFVGDVLLASDQGWDGFWSFNGFAYDTDPSYYFEKMLPLFSSDDYTVANCECIFTDRVLNPVEKEEDPGYWYYSETKNAGAFSDGRIEIVSLANNHALDYGKEGRQDTIDALESRRRTVLTEKQSLILSKDGVRVALLCVSMYGYAYIPPIVEWLESVSSVSDFQIVYFHGGQERTHVPEDWKIYACHTLVDAGADLVLGNHPHVLQPIETYHGVEIVYSLGNFLFGGAHTCENRTMVYRLTLSITNQQLESVSSEWIPCFCYRELWQPAPITDPDLKETVLSFLRGERETPF
ncbi:MAG: CapA family protein [Clostridia bacterium]|nr:CapA family protein [Clostridia bacterium]